MRLSLTHRGVRHVMASLTRPHSFIDRGQEQGMTCDALKQVETDLNAELTTGNLRVNVVMLPMSRNQLYSALASGKVDMVAALATVTPELEELVAFRIGREPVTSVSNLYKYYIAYRLMAAQRERRDAAKAMAGKPN